MGEVFASEKVSNEDGGTRAGGDEAESTEHALLDRVVVAACDIGLMEMHSVGMDVLGYTVVRADWCESRW